MKKEIFVVSDVHGCYYRLLELLNNFDSSKQELVLNGDLVDRGVNSRDVLLLANSLMHEGVATFVLGNHDCMLLDFLTQSEYIDMYAVWYPQGGRETACSLLEQPPTYVDSLTPKRLREELLALDFVKDTLELAVPYYEFGKVLCVHAGVPVAYQKEWRKTPKFELIWERGFHNYKNETGKVIVAGHTPTPLIHDKSNIWQNEDQDILMIDGACAYGGKLNGIVLDQSGKVLQTYQV